MTKLKNTLRVIVACAILSGSCGDGGRDAAEYCDALRDLMSAAPDYGLTGSEFDAELAAYLTALERAAAAAPPDQEAALEDFAGAMHFMAADPTAEGVSDRMGDALSGMLTVQEHGERECGLDFGAKS